jgi:hypothetical protein
MLLNNSQKTCGPLPTPSDAILGGRFVKGTLARIDAVLRPRAKGKPPEYRTDFIAEAVERGSGAGSASRPSRNRSRDRRRSRAGCRGSTKNLDGVGAPGQGHSHERHREMAAARAHYD